MGHLKFDIIYKSTKCISPSFNTINHFFSILY